MKVTDICHDVQNVLLENGFDFNELSSLHVGALKAIYDDRLDFANATDRMMDVVYELQEYGLVDTNKGLTKTGQQAIELTHILGGSRDRRRAANMKNAKELNLDDEEFDLDDEEFDLDDDMLPNIDMYDDDYDGNFKLGADDSVMQMNRTGRVNPYA